MKIIFYYDTRSLNDATSYYIEIIEKSTSKLGIEMIYTTKLKDVSKKDIVFTVTAKYYVQAKIRYPKNKTIFWAQGVTPEEHVLLGGGWFKFKIKEILEKIAVKNSVILFVVSNKMIYHYKEKYNYSGENYIVMPCYNLDFNKELTSQSVNRYKYPSFVYAGSMSAWQCVDETMELFGKIQKQIPKASLTLLVKEKEKAYDLVKKYNLKNVIIKYVQLDNLQTDLLNYKYGFLIREDNIVNNVATPTKMNSYLASGIIPIFTNAVDSFVENINLGKQNTICLSTNNSVDLNSNIIINHMNKNINILELLNGINDVFEIYYNDDIYINKITSLLQKRIL